MKKLVSICFLSIMFLVFSAQAQDCCFRLSNPNGPVLTDISNVPGGLQVNHQLTPLASLGRTDVYDLVFSNANCLGIDYETGKVSVEWELWCDGHQVTTDLSSYFTLTFQTHYNELQWIGGAVATGASAAQDYPGAIQQYQGTYNISNMAFDFFYFKFLANTQSRVLINWNRAVRDVKLIVRIRERVNGTNNELYWDENQRMNIGGHQSQAGRVLAADTLTTDPYFTATRIINDCEDVVVGRPAFNMHASGIYNIAYYDNTCGNRIDSIITYDYTHYLHPTRPIVPFGVAYCQFETATPIVIAPEPAPGLQDHVDQIVTYWSTDGIHFTEQTSFTPPTDVTGTFTYYVKRHDNLTGCESEVASFSIKINKLPESPVVADRIIEYCVGSTPEQLTYAAPAGQYAIWGTTPSDIHAPVAPTPTTDAAGRQVYYLKLKNASTLCESLGYDSIIVDVFANPVVTISADNDTLCQGEQATLSATTGLTSYQWLKGGSIIAGATSADYTYTNDVTSTGYVGFAVTVTEAHDEVTCKSKSEIYKIFAYETIGKSIAVRGDTALCGPGTTTLTVNNAANATMSVWYDAKSSSANELGRGTSYTAQFDATTTVYVASQNDFGCETPVEDWTAIKVVVNSIPQIVLTADNDGVVCAEENLNIYSTITEYSTPITYAWSGNGVKAPTTNSSVVFNNSVGGTYTVTLKVNDGNECKNTATIDITVDTLPVIVNGVDFTVTNNDYCVGSHGSIVFNTEYVRYSIDNGATWQAGQSFTDLPAGTYQLRVENGNGCVSHAVEVTIIDAPVMPSVTTTNVANTHCDAPYDGQLIAHATPAATYYYKLDGGAFQVDSVFTGLVDASTYTVLVKDVTTGCTATAANQTVENGRATIVVTAETADNVQCVAPYNGKIVVSVTPEATYTYALSGAEVRSAQSSNVFEGLNSGNYTVTVYNPTTKCSASQDFTVADGRVTPTVTLSQTANTHCVAPFNGQIDVTVAPTATYVYSKDAWSTQQTSSTFTGLEQGSYTIAVKDVFTYCENSASIAVTYEGVLPEATIRGLDNVCFGDTTKLSLVTTGDVVFDKWTYSGPAAGDTLLIQSIEHQQSFALPDFPAGKHTFTAHFHDTVTNCTNTKVKELRVIPVNIDLLRVTAEHVCLGNSTDVYCKYFPDDPSDIIVNYRWYARSWVPVSNDTITVTPSIENNRVSIIVTDNHGCTNSKYIDIVVNQLPDITLSTSRSSILDYCENDNTEITASTSHSGASFVWTKGGATITTAATVSTPVGTNDFDMKVEVTDDKGCKNDSTISINVITKPGAPIFVNDASISHTWYFCDYESISIPTSVQVSPTVSGQQLVWKDDKNPNVDKAEGTYTAHWAVTENTITCTSADSSVVVEVEPAVINSVELKYNSESAATTSHARCYDASATDKLTIDVDPSSSSKLVYTYKLNGGAAQSSNEFNITRTDPGVYTDTITVTLERTNPNGSHCFATQTLYYTLTVNSLPGQPDNFPTMDVSGTPTIFYCGGSAPSYSFATSGKTVKYSSLGAIWFDSPSIPFPLSGDQPGKVKVIDNTTSCEKIFDYQCVEVTVPTSVEVTTDLNEAYCGSPSVNGNFFALVKPSDVEKSYQVINYNWNSSERVISKAVRRDTLSKTLNSTSTISVTATVTAGTGSNYPATCGSKTGTITIDFQTPPTTPVLSSSTPGYIDANNVGYCTNGDAFSPVSVSIGAANFSTSLGASVELVGGYFPITTAGEYKIIAKNDDGLHCPSDTLTLKVTKYRELQQPTDYVSDIYYCQYTTATVPFGPATTNDSLAYYDGSTFLSTAPTTAGSYKVKVVDKEHTKCYITKDFEIHQVATPSLTVAITNPDIVQVCQGSDAGTISTTTSVDPTLGTQVVYTWNASSSNTSSISIGKISADSIIRVSAVATFTDHISCSSTESTDQITLKHYATPEVPTYTGDTAFCELESVSVSESDFSFGSGFTLSCSPGLPKTVTDNTVFTFKKYYTDFTSCESENGTVTITKNPLPTTSISPATTSICPRTSTTFTASGASTYLWSNDSTTATITVSEAGTYTVTGTSDKGCTKTASATLGVYPDMTVTMSDDTLICKDHAVTISATVSGAPAPYSYTWYKDGVPTSEILSGSGIVTFSTLSPIVAGMPVPYIYSVEVVDGNGCVSPADSNVTEVKVDNRAQFIFVPSANLIAHTGDRTEFDMYVDANCSNVNDRVFINYQIYKDGHPLTNEELSLCIDPLSTGSHIYNSSYTFNITAADEALVGCTIEPSNYNSASGDLPNSQFINDLGTSQYTWFYLHFLDNRKIMVNLGAWKQSGDYEITYAVIRASSLSGTHGWYYSTTKQIGGYGARAGLTVLDTLAFDKISISVVGESIASDSPTSISTIDESADLNMVVYPNPASNNVNVVLTGVQGQTVMSVYDMSGKVISSQRVNVDYDGQLYNLPVEGYAQGIYFIKVVNGDAVMTKKLIIAR